MRLLSLVLTGLCCSMSSAQTLPATTQSATTIPTSSGHPASRFDPARHMRVDEVKEGMKGYGLSVLSGTKITRFEVEVITVLHDAFGPDQSVVMIQCLDDYMKHVGPIAGCSGSPIYLYDASGNARLIGAYAFGWDLARDPIIGVQPIEYMLTLDKHDAKPSLTAAKRSSWSILDTPAIQTMTRSPRSDRQVDVIEQSRIPFVADAKTATGPRLRKLMTPLTVRGISQAGIDRLAPMLRAQGFEPMLAMGGGGAAPAGLEIEPGSVMGAAMLSGDLDLAAIGTCTEVIDGRAYGFGHPFNGEGVTSVPMGPGVVNLVMPVLTSSFKIGSVSEITGAIDMDGAYGIAGDVGSTARTFPITVEVDDQTIGRKKTYQFQCAVHRTFSPMLAMAAIEASLTADKQLPPDHTVSYSADLKFEGGRSVTLSNTATSKGGESVSQSSVWPAMLLSTNPFQPLHLEGLSVRATITNTIESVELLSASINQPSFKPGETVSIHLRLRPYQGDILDKTITLPLPTHLEDGDYNISIGDAMTNLNFLTQNEPQRFAIRDIDELFRTIELVAGTTQSDQLFVRLSGSKQNLSIGRTSLAGLPASKRAILEAAARPDVAVAVESTATSIPMDHPVSGSVDLVIRVAKTLP